MKRTKPKPSKREEPKEEPKSTRKPYRYGGFQDTGEL